MDCQFSETQFAFGLTYELLQILNPSSGWSAPCFPTQIDEAKLGYDCKLKGPVRTLYLQFKVSEKKVRSNASFWKVHGCQPYYEFKVRPDNVSQQHNLLVKLAKADPRNMVYYCAPCFYENDKYSEFFKHKKIASNTIFFDCKNIKCISGNDKHFITYKEDKRVAYFHSDPTQIEGLYLSEDKLLKELKEDASRAFASINEVIEHISSSLNINISGLTKTEEKLTRISWRLRMEYDLQLILY